MKQNTCIATIWVVVLSLGLVFTFGTAEASAQMQGQTFLSIPNLAAQLNTPEAVAKFMWANFLFENDQSNFGKEEYWQAPEEFIQTQKGDCEDFALFAKEILQLNGIKSFLLNIYGTRYAHTICVFFENGKYNVIDGTDVRRYEASSLEELMTRIYPHWKTGAIVIPSRDGDGGRIVKKITRD